MIKGKDSDSKIHEESLVQEAFLGKLTSKVVIIPSAGFGARVGSPPAKELLPHPKYPMSFLEKALERVNLSEASPLVVSRKDKSVLNEWLKKREIPHLLVDKTSEWVQTVFLTKPYWGLKNVLLLPDTDFSPENVIKDLFYELDKIELAGAVFPTSNLSLWGGFKEIDQRMFVAEKLLLPEKGVAWGLLGFTQKAGEEFWENYLEAQKTRQWVQLSGKVKLIELKYFEDLTRDFFSLKT